MRFTATQKKITSSILFMGAILMFVSCGSYQYAGYDNDGIYSSNQVVTNTREAANSRANSEYYANFFAEEAQSAQDILGESDVFTDIDSYSSGNVAVEDVEIVEGNYGGWGQVNDQVTINYYNNGWNNFGWGWNNPWLWNNWRWNRFGYGWNNFGWNYGLGYGWNVGFGWNNYWGWNRGYGRYYRNFNRGFYRNDFAYNRTRRGNSLRRSVASVNRRNTFSNRRDARLSRNRNTVGRRSSTTTRRRSTSSTIRNTRGIRNGNSTRRNSIQNRPSSRRNSSGGVRRGSSGRSSSSGSVRRSSGSSRSSGSIRPGRSSSRSSSGSRSSSRSSSRSGRRG